MEPIDLQTIGRGVYHSKFVEVKKVYSIWICMNTPGKNQEEKNVADTIISFLFQPDVKYCSDDESRPVFEESRYNLITVKFI